MQWRVGNFLRTILEDFFTSSWVPLSFYVLLGVLSKDVIKDYIPWFGRFGRHDSGNVKIDGSGKWGKDSENLPANCGTIFTTHVNRPANCGTIFTTHVNRPANCGSISASCENQIG
jgi:hypothetical protein